MSELSKSKQYSKALKLGLKTKKENLTEEQKEILQKFMEPTIIKKQLDDSIRVFLPQYDKYEDFYVYSPSFTLYESIVPYIYAYKKNTIYKLKFTTTYYSRTRMNPDIVILNSDGNNMIFKVFSSDNTILSYDTYKRSASAWVNLSDKEVYTLFNVMNGQNVSFKMKDASNSISSEAIVYTGTKELLKNGFWLYGAIRDGIIKRGQNRV